jgi:hypothetical protein
MLRAFRLVCKYVRIPKFGKSNFCSMCSRQSRSFAHWRIYKLLPLPFHSSFLIHIPNFFSLTDRLFRHGLAAGAVFKTSKWYRAFHMSPSAALRLFIHIETVFSKAKDFTAHGAGQSSPHLVEIQISDNCGLWVPLPPVLYFINTPIFRFRKLVLQVHGGEGLRT